MHLRNGFWAVSRSTPPLSAALSLLHVCERMTISNTHTQIYVRAVIHTPRQTHTRTHTNKKHTHTFTQHTHTQYYTLSVQTLSSTAELQKDLAIIRHFEQNLDGHICTERTMEAKPPAFSFRELESGAKNLHSVQPISAAKDDKRAGENDEQALQMLGMNEFDAKLM